MTLLELLEGIDDRIGILIGDLSKGDVKSATTAARTIQKDVYQARLFATSLESSLKLIPPDVLLSSGNPNCILGSASKCTEQITLSGISLYSDASDKQ